MSKFLFMLWNHNPAGVRSLEDVIGIVGHQLRALGHTAVWDPNNSIKEDLTYNFFFLDPSDGYNVVVEGFTEWSVGILRQAHAAGKRFICLATEEPTDKGFNHGLDREMRMRQETFREAAPYFDAIFPLVPGDRVRAWYSQFAPTHTIELGFAPTLRRQETQTGEPPYEFGFYGSLSKRRLRLLRKLAALTKSPNAVKIIADFPTQVERDRAMQEAKVILQIRKFDAMGLVSSSRCNTALCLGRPVVAEAHDTALSKPWDEIVEFTNDENDFMTKALLISKFWRGQWTGQWKRFQEKLDPQWCVGRALEATGTDQAPVSKAKVAA